MEKIITRKKQITIFVLAAFFLVFFLKGFFFIDPDFGWRLRSGGYFLHFGIPKTDIYTYTMPTFPWVDHAWSFDAMLALTYPVAKMLIPSLIVTIMAYLAILFSLARSEKLSDSVFVNLKLFGKTVPLSFLVVFVLLSLLSFFGVRVQITTWFLFSVFLYFLLDRVRWKKWRKLVPFFFLAWANLHGGFASGLIAFATVIATRFVKDKIFEKTDVALFIASVLVTVINPYGISLWREVWSSLSDPSLRFKIIEWRPAIFFPDFSFAFLAVFSVFLLVRYRAALRLEEIVLFVIFGIFGLSSMRNVPLWFFVALPVASKEFDLLFKDAGKIRFGKKRFTVVHGILWALVVILICVQFFLVARETARYTQSSFYPEAAVTYVRQHPIDGQLFAPYGWGGYLIWQYPEKKVFIDGRMPSWRWGDAPSGELDAAFDVYNDMLNGKVDVLTVFEQFNIQEVLWYKQREQSENSLETRLQDTLKKFNIPVNDFLLSDYLIEKGWVKTYEDDQAVVLIAPHE